MALERILRLHKPACVFQEKAREAVFAKLKDSYYATLLDPTSHSKEQEKILEALFDYVAGHTLDMQLTIEGDARNGYSITAHSPFQNPENLMVYLIIAEKSRRNDTAHRGMQPLFSDDADDHSPIYVFNRTILLQTPNPEKKTIPHGTIGIYFDIDPDGAKNNNCVTPYSIEGRKNKKGLIETFKDLELRRYISLTLQEPHPFRDLIISSIDPSMKRFIDL